MAAIPYTFTMFWFQQLPNQTISYQCDLFLWPPYRPHHVLVNLERRSSWVIWLSVIDDQGICILSILPIVSSTDMDDTDGFIRIYLLVERQSLKINALLHWQPTERKKRKTTQLTININTDDDQQKEKRTMYHWKSTHRQDMKQQYNMDLNKNVAIF